jgi:hypothetical protein
MEQSQSSQANSHSSDQVSAFYGTKMFITVFTRGRHWSLSWARWIQFTPSQSILLIPWSKALLYKPVFSWSGNYLPFMEPKIHYRVHKTSPLDPILSQMNPIHTFPPYFSKTHSAIISQSTQSSSEWSRDVKIWSLKKRKCEFVNLFRNTEIVFIYRVILNYCGHFRGL